jgi:hypothetical protein
MRIASAPRVVLVALVTLVTFVILGVGVPAARAGCPNTCEATAEAAVVTPPLTCATFEAIPQSCDCSLLLSLQNNCPGAIIASDFMFGSCQTSAGTGEQNCTTVAPGGRGSLFLRVSVTGRKDWSLHVHGDDGDHTVAAAIQVTSFGSGSGCSYSSSRARDRGRLADVMVVAAAVALGIRRRARRPARDRNRG